MATSFTFFVFISICIYKYDKKAVKETRPMSLLCDEDHPSSKFVENTKALSLAEELDFEYDNGSSSSVEATTVDVSEIVTDRKGDDDVEEGEIVDTSDCIARKPCRFYQQGECFFGKYCNYLHISDKGLYNMFDHSPIVCYSPNPRESVECSRELDFETVDTSWEQSLKEAMQRVKQWDLARQKKVCGNIGEKVLCDSKQDSQTYTCKSPVRKSWPHDTPNETSRKKSVVPDHLGRQNFHSTWRDPWRRSPGRKILPSPPTSRSCSSRSSSPSKGSSRSNQRRRNRRSSLSKTNYRSTRSSDSSSPSLKRKLSSRSKPHRRDSWICKTRHRSTSSCHSSSSPLRKRLYRSRQRYRDRRSSVSKTRHRSSRSKSSSRSLSPRPFMPFAKNVKKRFGKEMRLGREKSHVDTKMTASRTDTKAPPIKSFSRKLEITRKKVNVYPADSFRRRKESAAKQVAEKSTREDTESSTSHWTPKKVKHSSCSDMSISPLSSPLIEVFKPQRCQRKNSSSINKEVSQDVPKKVCTKSPPGQMQSSASSCFPGQMQSSASSCFPGQVQSSASSSLGSSTFGGKCGTVRKKVDPLEQELMKCNKNFISMKRCFDIGRPRSKATEALNVTGAKSKKTVKDENEIPPSRKEILLKRLEAVNAAIARRTKKSW